MWTFTGDFENLPRAAQAWLRRDPVRNTVPITVLRGMGEGLWNRDILLGWLTEGAEVTGVVLHTPPYPVLLSDLPVGAVPSLAEELRGREVPGVSGPLAQAEAFLTASGREEKGRTSQRLYRLDGLRIPRLEGRVRSGGPEDTEPALEWMTAFQAEAVAHSAERDLEPQVKHRLHQGELVFWERDGRAVAMAGFSRPVGGMSRIGPVYTPPELRGRGHGTAVAYAATRAAQEAGAHLLLLFTDLANPTSNSIYQALGYRPVGDYAAIMFTPDR
ncbi:GNAT family N-acetyltransferase [Sphaerisporangium sp. TRM90804]|uniref:GNAT family N-acetyltransferase n=1 Tax=Sphaerisporangium sp. TRM90804 TaxID=3031113 RepID=UPI002448E83B|nr:GNAT family N-acetyltransferase [Sphaerisporangium sp. TRM90804]MDH2428177.1 GNAT family N-acetyltransferase [Sphaerisporangium sp. TRM90804]